MRARLRKPSRGWSACSVDFLNPFFFVLRCSASGAISRWTCALYRWTQTLLYRYTVPRLLCVESRSFCCPIAPIHMFLFCLSAGIIRALCLGDVLYTRSIIVHVEYAIIIHWWYILFLIPIVTYRGTPYIFCILNLLHLARTTLLRCLNYDGKRVKTQETGMPCAQKKMYLVYNF